MKQFNRVFAPVNNERFDKSALYDLANDTIFVCPVPMFDDIKDRHDLFEHYIDEHMKDFNPETDCIADFGDSMIFAMMIFYVAMEHDRLYVARYNRRASGYTIRLITTETDKW